MASIYRKKKLVVFKLDKSTNTWSQEAVFTGDDMADVIELKVFKFFTATQENVHLFVARWDNDSIFLYLSSL